MTRAEPHLSVVVPLYDEVGNVSPLVAAVSECLAESASWELILVDDGSVDVVFLHEVLKALREERRQKVLKEIHRVLKVGGALSFSSHHARKGEIISTVTEGGLFKVEKKGEDLYRFEKVPV